MNELLDLLRIITKLDKGDKFEYFAYLAEELGEVATCLCVEDGLKNKKLKESTIEECGDVITQALALIVHQNPQVEWSDIKTHLGKKINRWKTRLEEKQ